MCAEPTDRGLELVIQVVLKAGDASELLLASFNGTWPSREHTRSERLLLPCGALSHHAPANIGCDFRFPVALVRDGWNEIVVENGGDKTITVVGIELAIRSKVASV
jgi:hypothetical protein